MGNEGDGQISVALRGVLQCRELLHHLRLMSMAAQAVGREVGVDLGEVRSDFQRSSRPRNSRLSINDRAPVQPAFRGQRRQGENCRGRIAAGHADQARLRDRVAMQLRQPIDRLGQQMRRRMLAVPLFVRLFVVEAEIGRRVDHRRAALDERRQPLGRRSVGQSGEDHIDVVIDLGHDRQVERPQVREDLGQTLAHLGTTGHADDLDTRVLREQTRQLRSHVSSDVDDRCPDRGSGGRGAHNLFHSTTTHFPTCQSEKMKIQGLPPAPPVLLY